MVEGEEGGQRRESFTTPLSALGSTVLTLTSPDENLHRLELNLRCLKEDKDGEVLPINDGFGRAVPPLMNEFGVTSTLNLVQSIVSRVTILSNLDIKEVLMLTDFLGDTLSRDLMINRVYYGIMDVSARDKIYFACLSQGYICLKRAFEEGDRRFLKGSQQEITSRIQQESQGGIMSRLLGWGKKNG